MTKLKLLGGAIVLLTAVVWGTATAFDVADISGSYGVNTEGTLTIYDDSDPPQVVALVPTTSVGLFNAKGDGTGNFVGTSNVGGVAIIPIASAPENSATYTVEESGLGVIKAPVAAATGFFHAPNPLSNFQISSSLQNPNPKWRTIRAKFRGGGMPGN